MILHRMILFAVILFTFNQVRSVHNRHLIRKSALQRKAAEIEYEEELNEEDDENENEFARAEYEPLQRHSKRQTSNFMQKDSYFAESQGESRDFLQFLQKINYDHRQIPQEAAEITMDYSLEMFYRESWLDKRLSYDPRNFRNKTVLALHESYSNYLWHPDTFMPNAIASKNPRKQSVSHRSLLRLQSDGTVLYSRRISVVAECQMDLTLFPFDSQTCKLGIESYGYTSDQVRYWWSANEREALKLLKIRLPDFKIKEAFTTTQLENYATAVCFMIVFLSLIKLAIMKYMRQRLKMANDLSSMNLSDRLILSALFPYLQTRIENSRANSLALNPCDRPSEQFKRTKQNDAHSENTKTVASSSKSPISSALGVSFGKALFPIIRHLMINGRKNSQGNPTRGRYQQPLSVLTSNALNLPLTQTHLNQLQQYYLLQQQNETELQRAKTLQQLIWERNRRKERHRRRNQNQLRKAYEGRGMDKPDEFNGNFCRGRKYGRIDLNGNGIGAPRRKLLKSSPIGGGDVRIGIEPSSPNSSSEEMERDRTGLSPGKSIDKKAKRMFFCFDQFGNVEFTLNFMRRFHWISQMTFFFGFILFCFYFFIIYPNSRTITQDPACLRENADWLASIPA